MANWRGHWANGNNYVAGDIVSIGNHVAPYYLCYSANTNMHPRDYADYWHVLGQASLVSHTWQSNVTFRYGDMVRHNSEIYICITTPPATSLNDQPDTSSSDWKVLSGGPTGAPGAPGDDGADGADGTHGGPVAIEYTFKSDTANADPGNGNMRIGSASLSVGTPTILRLDNLDANATDWSSVLADMADSTSTVKGHIRVAKASDLSKWAVFEVTAVADQTGYYNIGATPVGYSSATPFAADDSVVVFFAPKGDKGDAGQNGSTTSGGVTLWATNGFRLTLESDVPDDVEDRSAKSTIYWTPYTSDAVALFDGSNWNIRNVSERSIALSGLTADKNYDVFVYDNAGTPTLELGPAWTDDTTRATDIVRLNGVWVKDGTPTRRYVGSFRSTSTSTTESTNTNRFLYNFDNPLPTQMYSVGNFNHTYNSTATRLWGNSDTYATSKVLIGVGNQRIVEGTAGSYGYGGSYDARIFVCISDDVLDFPLEAETSLVMGTTATWTWVEASRKRLPQGLNYIRLCQRYFGSSVGNYSWYVRNFTVQL